MAFAVANRRKSLCSKGLRRGGGGLALRKSLQGKGLRLPAKFF